MKKKIQKIALIIWLICSVIGIGIIITFAVVKDKNDNAIVETYESGLDEIAIDFDDDKLGYDVCIGSVDKVTSKYYFVKLEDVVVIPFTENEVLVEVTKNGKCKLYFFIKWEVE